MKKRFPYGMVVCILLIQMLFSDSLLCHAAQITSVSISPGTVVVSKGGNCTFVAAVSGEDDYSSEVVWSVSGQTSGSTFIDSNGVLNVGPDETASSMVVKAVSRQDSRYSASALVSLQVSSYFIQLRALPENGGAVYGGGTVNEGGYAMISAVPNNGFVFDGWFLNENKISDHSQYVVDNIRSDGTYTAQFKPIDCRIDVNVNDSSGGTATGSKTVGYGESVTLEAWPKEGYRFVRWTENGQTVSSDQKYSVNVSRDMSLVAVFEKKQPKTYTITATASDNGTITPEGQSTVAEGAWVSYSITPQNGYFIKNVYVDGKQVGSTATYNFSQVWENHTISAEFAPIPEKDQNEDGAAAGTIKPEEGTKAEITDNTDIPDREEEGTDEQEAERNPLTGTLQYLNISVEEAGRLIAESDEAELMEGALETGDLQVTIRNAFADAERGNTQNSIYENSDVPNLGMVLEDLLSVEEKLDMLQGNAPVSIDLHIEDTNGKETPQVQKAFAENKLPGMDIGQYFEMYLLVSKNNDTQTVTELPEALRVIIHVPAHLKVENRKFYILRLHTKEDGSQDFAQLVDEDDDPDTITFSTDQFSPYAIAYVDRLTKSEEPPAVSKKEPEGRQLRNAAGIFIVFLALGATVTGVLYIAGKRKR